MKPDRINYQKTFNLGNYTSERIGMEAQIDDGENVQEKLLVLKNLVEDFHQKNKPVDDELSAVSNYVSATINNLSFIERKEEQGTEAALIKDINSCTELKVLESYRFIAAKTPQLQEAYNNKLKQLT